MTCFILFEVWFMANAPHILIVDDDSKSEPALPGF